MKTKIKVSKEVEIKTLLVNAGVRYWEDAVVDGADDERGKIPCRKNGLWCPEIEVDTGKIINWTQGVEASVHYKVCDSGFYQLKDAEGNVVGEIDGYVPSCMSPKENGYGDYIIMDIDAKGIINNWKFSEEDVDAFENNKEEEGL